MRMENTSQEQPVQKPEKPKMKNRKLFIFLIVLIILILTPIVSIRASGLYTVPVVSNLFCANKPRDLGINISQEAKVMVLSLNYDQGDIKLNKIGLQRGNPILKEGNYEYRLYSKNKLIYSSKFDIPLTLYEDKFDKETKEFTKSEKKLDRADFQMAVPYFNGVDSIRVYDEDGKLALNEKLKSPLKQFKEYNCYQLFENNNPSTKINVVFVPDGYTDLEKFRQDVLKHIDLESQNQGIFSTEPFNENKNMFNFYYISEILDYNCEFGCGATEIFNKASQCPYSNQVIVLTDTTTYFGYASLGLAVAPGHTGTFGTSFVTGPMVTSHEFGHSFGELADEYYGQFPGSATFKTNCDIASYNPGNPQSSVACPKWCSGPAKVPYTTECSNFNEADCKDLYNSRRFNCVWLDQPDPYFGTRCIKSLATPDPNDPISIEKFNIGQNCIEGTGCYLNCHGTNGYRPTFNNCIMNGFKQNNNVFDPVCKKQITSVLKRYNNAPVIISKPNLFAIENTNYYYDVNASDEDNDILTYSLINAPEGMIINSLTGLITWAPTEDQLGDYFIKIEVKDNFETSRQSFNLKVIQNIEEL